MDKVKIFVVSQKSDFRDFYYLSSPLKRVFLNTSITFKVSLYFRDMDKVILESVKIHGPGSKTFEDISKGFPGSTAAQVSGT